MKLPSGSGKYCAAFAAVGLEGAGAGAVGGETCEKAPPAVSVIVTRKIRTEEMVFIWQRSSWEKGLGPRRLDDLDDAILEKAEFKADLLIFIR